MSFHQNAFVVTFGICMVSLVYFFLIIHVIENKRWVTGVGGGGVNMSSKVYNHSDVKARKMITSKGHPHSFQQCLDRASRASGVYVNATKPDVIVTALNYGYRYFIPAWVCNARRSGWKFLIIALDQKLYAYLQGEFPSETFCLYTADEGMDLSPASDFRKPVYNKVTCIKIDVVLYLLRADYSVFFMDIDVRWTSDVWAGVKDSPCDYTFQINNGKYMAGRMGFDAEGEGNTGVYYAKPKGAVIRLFEQVSRDRCDNTSSQAIFWNEMRRQYRLGSLVYFPDFVKAGAGSNGIHAARGVVVGEDKFSYCPLHPIQFAAGWAFSVRRGFRDRQDVRLVHANYMIGRDTKLKALKREGYVECSGN